MPDIVELADECICDREGVCKLVGIGGGESFGIRRAVVDDGLCSAHRKRDRVLESRRDVRGGSGL